MNTTTFETNNAKVYSKDELKVLFRVIKNVKEDPIQFQNYCMDYERNPLAAQRKFLSMHVHFTDEQFQRYYPGLDRDEMTTEIERGLKRY